MLAGKSRPLLLIVRTTIGAAAAVACALPVLQAGAALLPSPDGVTVYDTVNNVSWLADANLAATNRFGLPLCTGPGTQTCVNASGSMRYDAAVACGLPASAQAYSLNFAAVPQGPALGYMTAWPAGQSQPLVASLNDPTGTVLSNAVVVPAGCRCTRWRRAGCWIRGSRPDRRPSAPRAT